MRKLRAKSVVTLATIMQALVGKPVEPA